MAQKFVRLIKTPAGPAPEDTKQKIVGLIFPVLSGYVKSIFEDTHGNLDEKTKFNVSGANFINAILGEDNAEEIMAGYESVFGRLEANMLISFNKHECEEVIF